MNSKNLYKLFITSGWLLMAVVAFNACKKGEKYAPSDGAGNTIVKIKDAEKEITVIARDVNPVVETFGLIDLRRDANSGASLRQALSVKVILDQDVIDTYNDDNGTDYELMPADAYTLSEDINNLTFQPGEHAKQIKITVDKNKLDLSKRYALGISLNSVGDGAVISQTLNKAIYAIGLKNKYDGVYEVTGTMVDYGSSALTGLFPFNYYLITSGANSVDGFDPDHWGDYFIPIYNGPDVSGYGSFSPVFNFDPATDKITSVVNIYGQPAGNTRSAELDPSGVNAYDPVTKTIKVKFFMKQPSVITTPPNIRVAFDWTLKYTGAR
jgi:hypothetical protein